MPDDEIKVKHAVLIIIIAFLLVVSLIGPITEVVLTHYFSESLGDTQFEP